MMDLVRLTLFSLIFCIPQSHAAQLLDKLTAQKQCEANWQADYQSHNKHIGKMVCDCAAMNAMQFQKEHATESNLDQKTSQILKHPSHYCLTQGIFTNTVSRATYFFITNPKSIEDICDTSWVGVMRAFNSTDSTFDSKKICQCASSELTQSVNQSDTLSPSILRTRMAALVKKCDSNASAEFTKVLFQEHKLLNRGTFDLEIKKDKESDANDIANYLRNKGQLKTIVSLMNQTINIPYPIHIVTTSAEMGPVYIPENKTIKLDYQLMEIILALYTQAYPKQSKENRFHYFNNVNRFLLYHELGHALIDAYHLPVLGQQEDAADALGAIISLNYNKRGYHILLDAADFFSLMEKAAPSSENNFWDEHSLNKQRYYRLLCFAYGSNPKEVREKIIKNYQNQLKSFLNERADYCKDDYQTTYGAWMVFLKPYFKILPNQPKED